LSYFRLSGCLGYDFATTPYTVAAAAPPPPLSAIASVPSDRRRLFCSGDCSAPAIDVRRSCFFPACLQQGLSGDIPCRLSLLSCRNFIPCPLQCNSVVSLLPLRPPAFLFLSDSYDFFFWPFAFSSMSLVSLMMEFHSIATVTGGGIMAGLTIFVFCFYFFFLSFFFRGKCGI
jgi:hypothetical protein